MIRSKHKIRRRAIIEGRARVAYEGPYPNTFAGAAVLGGLGAVFGGIIGGPLGAAIGAAVGAAIGGYLGNLEDQEEMRRSYSYGRRY